MYTDMEQWAEIRRRVLNGEISKRGACAEYEIHWNTLKKILTHTDSAQATTDEYTYSAYGKTLTQTGTTENPFTYKGQIGYYQDEDGLQLLRNRRYSPGQGRFISEDPIGLESGESNFYRYVENDPVNTVDPSGLEEIVFWPMPRPGGPGRNCAACHPVQPWVCSGSSGGGSGGGSGQGDFCDATAKFWRSLMSTYHEKEAWDRFTKEISPPDQVFTKKEMQLLRKQKRVAKVIQDAVDICSVPFLARPKRKYGPVFVKDTEWPFNRSIGGIDEVWIEFKCTRGMSFMCLEYTLHVKDRYDWDWKTFFQRGLFPESAVRAISIAQKICGWKSYTFSGSIKGTICKEL